MNISKKNIFIGISFFVLIMISYFFFSAVNAKKEVWLIADFYGDKENRFSDALVNELRKNLSPSPKVILKKIKLRIVSEDENGNKEALNLLKDKNAGRIFWGQIKDKKVSFNITILNQSSCWVRINNTAAGLLQPKEIKINDDFNAFDKESLLKKFIQGYLKYIGKNYKESISVWEELTTSNNPLISFYLANAYFLSSQKVEKTKDNQSKAYEYYQAALAAINQNEKPYFHQATLNNLGILYIDSPFGKHKENLANAQKCLEQAVKISINDFSSEEYGITLNNLILAYKNIPNIEVERFNRLIKGNTSEIIRVSNKLKNKEMEAVAYNNLGASLTEKMKENNVEYIDEAIATLENGKKIISKRDFPETYYLIVNNLGLAYGFFNQDDVKKNKQLAIKYLQQSRNFFSRKKFPKEFALISKNLGNVYLEFNDQTNFFKARENFQQALEIYKEEEHPIQFAFVKESLGNTYFSLLQEKNDTNFIQAIEQYKSALRIINQDNFPGNFYNIVSNLAVIFSSLKQNRTENLKKALIFYEKALEFYNKNKYPYQYAMLKNNLGNVWKDMSHLASDNQDKNQQLAIECFNDAMKVYEYLGKNKEYMMTKTNLANVYAIINVDRKINLEKAISLYKEAISNYQIDKDYYNIIRQNLRQAQIDLDVAKSSK